MDFSFDETQQAVAGLTADVLRREGRHDPPGWATTDDRPWDETTWKAMAEAGVLGLAVPVADGGDGLGLLETAAVLAEVGRHAAAVPALPALALGVLPVARHGTATQCAALLPGVAAGTHILTAAARRAAPAEPPSVTADATHRLRGAAIGVPCAAAAYRILVPAATARGSAVYLVAPAADGVELVRTPTASGAPEYTLRLDGAQGEPLGEDTSGAAVQSLHRHAVAGACALTAGLLDGALALTAEHLRTREQFGRPLATFQAVAQQIAEVYTAARTLRLATLSACWRLATGRDDGDLDVAAYWLTAEAPPALRTCHHLHGGIGVDATYPLHRFSSAVKDLARFVGDRAESQDRLGARIGR